MRNRASTAFSLTVITMLLAVAAGCANPAATFSESGTSYDEATVEALHLRAAESALLGAAAAEIPALRHDALVDIRSTNSQGARAADLMTETFPATTRGVPVYVESAQWKGVRALLVVELLGKAGGPLKDSRVWAIGPDGTVLYSSVR